jgi:hypothetical protein
MSSPKDENRTTDKIEVSFDETKKVLNLSKAQLKALGLQYKAPQTEAQMKRNKVLSEMSKARHEKQRKEKEDYERAQIEALQKKIAVEPKPKQKYNKKMIKIPLNSSESESESEVNEDFEEYLRFKQAKIKAKKIKKQTTKSRKEVESKSESSSDDEMIQKKTKKATKIIETVNKLDSAINKMSVGNPYLDLFNKTKK